MQTFRGLCRRGWSGQIASLTHMTVSFVLEEDPYTRPGPVLTVYVTKLAAGPRDGRDDSAAIVKGPVCFHHVSTEA